MTPKQEQYWDILSQKLFDTAGFHSRNGTGFDLLNDLRDNLKNGTMSISDAISEANNALRDADPNSEIQI